MYNEKSTEHTPSENEKRLAADLDVMTRIQKVGALFAHENDLDVVLGEVLDTAIAISGSDFGNIQILDAKSKELHIVVYRGFPDWWIDFWKKVHRGQGTCGTALERGERVIIEDVNISPIFIGTPALEIQRKAGVRAVQSTPIVSRSGEPLGMFSTHYKRPYRPDDRILQYLDMLAHHAADIIERSYNDQILKRDKETFEKLVQEKTGELVNVQIELERSKRLSDIGALAATVAHELRNPLAAISMAAENIQRKAKDAAVLKSHLLSIHKKVVESDQIINNLLFYSKLREPNFKNMEIYAALETCVNLMEGQFKEKIILIRQFESLKNIFIKADELQIQEVFSNLLNNAHDAMTDRQGKITITAFHDTDSVQVNIKDDGAGITQENLKRVFDPFFTTKARGTGLGLTVCYQIIRMHEGSIRITSPQGEGTVVQVTLPKDGKIHNYAIANPSN